MAVVALRDGGLGLVDVTNATRPVIAVGGASTPAWAGAVKTVGNRVYAGLGTRLQIFDLVGGALNPVANLDAGAWVTGIDVAGSAIVVATDGKGARIFETDPGGALDRSTFLAVTRVRAVRVTGTMHSWRPTTVVSSSSI